MSTTRRFVSLIALSVACSALPACNNQDTAKPETETKTQPATPSAAPAMQQPGNVPGARRGDRRKGDRRGMRRGGGVMGQFFSAALALELKDDQKGAIEKIQEGLAPKDETTDARKTAMEALNKEISAGIKAGKIDTTKLDPLFADVEKAHKDRQEAEAKALNELHAKLDATQRKSVVESIRADQKKRAERMEKMMEHAKAAPAAPAADDKADDDKTAAKKDAPWMGRRGFGMNRLERLTRDLELDDAQKKKVEALAAKEKPVDPKAMGEEQQKRMTTILDAFEKDTFDATKLDLSTTPPVKAHSKAMIDALTALLGIVKPEQREKLAEAVERQHKMGGRMGRGGRGGRMGRGGPGGRMGPGGPPGPGMMQPPMDDLEDDDALLDD